MHHQESVNIAKTRTPVLKETQSPEVRHVPTEEGLHGGFRILSDPFLSYDGCGNPGFFSFLALFAPAGKTFFREEAVFHSPNQRLWSRQASPIPGGHPGCARVLSPGLVEEFPAPHAGRRIRLFDALHPGTGPRPDRKRKGRDPYRYPARRVHLVGRGQDYSHQKDLAPESEIIEVASRRRIRQVARS